MALPVALRYTEHEAHSWLKHWRSWSFSFFVMPLLFLGGLGFGLGGYVDAEAAADTIGGLDYLAFVAPGLLAGGIMQNMYGDLWGVMAGFKWQGPMTAAAATPLRPADVFLGFLAWRVPACAAPATSFVVVAALLGGVPSAWGVLAIPAATLCGLVFSAMAAAWSITRERDSSFPVVIRVLATPMFVFSGTFFPVSELPAAAQGVVKVLPLWHAIELCRGATTGTLGLVEGLGHTAYLLAWLTAAVALGIRGFNRRLTS
ncbi:MAG TPA: ABC transporter permease [Acidimicrobiales bacterium]